MTQPTLQLPVEVLYILYQLDQHGYQAYLIGGSVRDYLANSLGYYQVTKPIDSDDFDLTTNATPEQIMSVFPHSFYENNFGTVSITPSDLRSQMGLPPP